MSTMGLNQAPTLAVPKRWAAKISTMMAIEMPTTVSASSQVRLSDAVSSQGAAEQQECAACHKQRPQMVAHFDGRLS